MPARDGTGPRGMGPMTGRGMGFCGPGADRPGGGYGLGYGYGRGGGFRGGGFGRCAWPGGGRGRGWRNMYYATGVPGWGRGWMHPGFGPYAGGWSEADDLEALKGYAANLEEALRNVQTRVSELEKQ